MSLLSATCILLLAVGCARGALFEGRANAVIDREGNVHASDGFVKPLEGEPELASFRQKREVRNTLLLTSDQIDESLTHHHKWRSQQHASNMNYLYWNATLADYAQEFGDTCQWGHGQPSRTDAAWEADWIGQNMYFRSVDYDVSYAIERWNEEIQYYDYDTMECNGAMCGHYTQLTWATSEWVGCGKTECTNLIDIHSGVDYGHAYLYICNYGSGGNVVGTQPFKKGDNCTECSSNTFWCYDGMCRDNCAADSLRGQCECAEGCKHGSVNQTTCTCTSCNAGWKGDICDTVCENTSPDCGVTRGWKEKHCTGTNQASLEFYCPVLCGLCEGANGVTTTAEPIPTTPGADVSSDTATVSSGMTSSVGSSAAVSTSTTAADVSTTAPFVETAAPGSTCDGWACYNGATLNTDPCSCTCVDGYQGEYCSHASKEATSGVEIEIAAQLEQWVDIEPNLLEVFRDAVNDICVQEEYYGECCPGSTGMALVAGQTYVTLSNIEVGQGYPVVDSEILMVLIYVELPETSSFCNTGSRKKRSLADSLTLPQEVLYEAVVSSMSNLTSTLSDCCGVTVQSVNKGQNETGWTYYTSSQTDESGLESWVIAVIVVSVVIALVVVVLIVLYVLIKTKKGSKQGSKVCIDVENEKNETITPRDKNKTIESETSPSSATLYGDRQKGHTSHGTGASSEDYGCPPVS